MGPATPEEVVPRRELDVPRSTKAGPVGPATPTLGGSGLTLTDLAQRRPARWGRQPRCPNPIEHPDPLAQRRPARWGRQPPPSATGTPWPPPLNEGRPGGAGNPNLLRTAHYWVTGAQRRPARWGRQPIRVVATLVIACSAQRRPARWGRQPERQASGDELLLYRSTKAGPVGPATRDGGVTPTRPSTAQRRPARWGRQPLEGCHPSRGSSGPPLNEGRPGGAGNPTGLRRVGRGRLQRSTKAGPVGPATLVTVTTAVPLSPIAQRRPARWGRQPDEDWLATDTARRRSTKAGPVGPATPTRRCPHTATGTSLNEGRPGGAGNPRPG